MGRNIVKRYVITIQGYRIEVTVDTLMGNVGFRLLNEFCGPIKLDLCIEGG